MALLEKALPVLYFLFVFFLYFSLLSDPYFTDEQDVIFGGYHISKGKDLYQHYLSQHMPFSYYFAAVSAFFGARTVYQFRLGAYLLLSAVWECIYLRHRKHLPALFFGALPLLYLSLLKTVPYGTSMISEHWQGIGQVIILLELIRYAKEKRISLPCAWMVSLGIMLSFGTVFVAAYPVFCYFLGMVALQIRFCLEERKKGAAGWGKRMLKEDFRLAAVSLAPFALLLIWYAVSGNVTRAYEGAYDVNIRYYSQYTGGFGSDPLGVVWETPAAYGSFLWQNIMDPGGYHLLNAALILGTVVCCVWLGRSSPVVGLTALLATVYSGMRAFDGFHGMAYYAQAAALLALGWSSLLQRKKHGKKPISWGLLIASGGAAAFLLAGFFLWAGYNLLYPQVLLDRTPRAETRLLDVLTDPEEEIHSCETPYFSQDVMDLELIPQEACDAVSIPWYYDMWKDRQLASIQRLPHVLLYDSEEQTWGVTFREHAKDFDDYIRAHYTKLSVAEDVWVANSFLGEADQRLEKAGYGRFTDPEKENYPSLVPREFYAGDRVQAAFTARGEKARAVKFCAACFRRRSDPRLTIRILDPETQQVCGEGTIQGEDIADDFYSRCPLEAALTPGKQYEVDIQIDQIGGKGDMEFYFRPSGELALAVEYD